MASLQKVEPSHRGPQLLSQGACHGANVPSVALLHYIGPLPDNSVRFAASSARNLPFRSPEEFRAPKAYESLGGTNPRWAGLCLWGFGILADAGSGGATAAACPPPRFVPVSVRGVLVLRAAMIADIERWSVADEIGHEIG